MLFAPALVAVALTLAGFACERIGPPGAPAVLGAELPLASGDGVRGLAARDGVRLALGRWNAAAAQPVDAIVCDSASHVANPHQDEGSDDPAQAANGAALVRAFGVDGGIVAVVGGLRPDVAAAEAPAAQALSLALLSPSTTPVPGAQTFFRTGHSDEAEASLAHSLASEAGWGTPAVQSRDPARSAALRAALGAAAPEGATLFAGPAVVGSIVASRAASGQLESMEILRLMERRGFEFPPTAGAAFAVTAVAGMARADVDAYERRAVAASGNPASDDTFAYDDATSIALEAIAAASTSGSPRRADVVRALRVGSFLTLSGSAGFTRAGALRRACYEVRSLQTKSAQAAVRCVELRR